MPTLLTGQVDALGNPWTSAAVTRPWTAASWAAGPWAAVTAEIPGSAAAPAWTGPRLSPLAWEAGYLGATDPVSAGWDTKYWGTKYWGTKYWGTGMWQ